MHRWQGWVSVDVVVAGVALIALAAKIKLMQSAALGPIWFTIIKHDALLFAIMLLTYAVAVRGPQLSWSGGRALARGALILLGFAILLYCADVFAYWFFVTRLYISDVVTFSGEMSSAISLLKSAYWIARKSSNVMVGVLAAILVVAVYALLRLSVFGQARARSARYPLAASVVCTVLYLVPVPALTAFYGDKPLYENVLERNSSYFRRNVFSQEFRSKLLSASDERDVCRSGRQRPLNVILVVVESLSAYHSAHFSGLQDWTPELDRIAKEHTSLVNFHANGWTTIGGLISLLGGDFPLVPERASFNEWGSPRLGDFSNPSRPIAKRLADRGYATAFLAAGDIGFLDQRQWLGAVGFQHIVSNDDPRFSSVSVRGPFGSVPDGVLFEVATREVARLEGLRRPYFLVVQTYWSHRPFLTPHGKQANGEAQVIREADAQIAAFYKRLRDSGFLQNGLIFITGDHRAMEPFDKEEHRRFGSSRITRIPGIVATRALPIPKRVEEDFQQRDFAASIESIVMPRFCLRPLEGSFLADPIIPSSCVLHARGDDRDLIYVKCGDKEGTVRTDGDRTAFADGNVHAPQVISVVNRSRVRLEPPAR